MCTSTRGNIDLLSLISRWAADQKIRDLVSSEGHSQHAFNALGALGEFVFTTNFGNYANELRLNISQSQIMYDENDICELGLQQTRHLFLLLCDAIFGVSNLGVRTRGLINFTDSIGSGNGVILLGVFQSHPNLLLESSSLLEKELAIVRHGGNWGNQSFLLNRGRRVFPIIDTTSNGAKGFLEYLRRGQIVALYNDFVYPESKPIQSVLFGREVNISRSLVKIIHRNRPSVVPVSIARSLLELDSAAIIEFFPALDFKDLYHLDEQCALKATAIRLGIATECLIRKNPAHWVLWNSLAGRWNDCLG